MLNKRYFVAACCLISFVIAPPAKPETVEVTGGMSTVVKFQDHIYVNVPSNVQSMTVKVPVPADCTLFGFSQDVGDVHVVSSREPDASKFETDDSGNKYAVDYFANPPQGTIVFTIVADQAKISVDLQSPLPSCPANLTNVSNSVAQYLKPTSKVQSDDPIIAALASELLSGAPDEATVTNRIQHWLQSNITYDITAENEPDDAISVLTRKAAICDGWAHLFLALARADGLPARFVGGYNLGGHICYPLDSSGNSTLTVTSDNQPHSWVEVWFPGSGWVPFEPQASSGFVDSHHLAVWTGADAGSIDSIVSWTCGPNDGQNLSLSESESPAQLSDQVNVSCNADGGSTNFMMLERRAGSQSTNPAL